MKKQTTIEEKIRRICTYYSDDPLGGTSGYNLSEDQFQKLFKLFNSELDYLAQEVEKLKNSKEKIREWRVRDLEAYNVMQWENKRIDQVLQLIRERGKGE